MFQLAPNVLSRRVGDEMVLLDLDDDLYFSLDPVGAEILEALLSFSDEESAIDSLLGHFDVDRARLSNDVAALRRKLIARGLAVENT
jgi:hypothetical protein